MVETELFAKSNLSEHSNETDADRLNIFNKSCQNVYLSSSQHFIIPCIFQFFLLQYINLAIFTCAEHLRCDPGTESEVISIVIDLRKKIVPPKLHIRLKMISLNLCFNFLLFIFLFLLQPSPDRVIPTQRLNLPVFMKN